MGVEVAVCGASDDELAAIRRLFEDWERVFSRFRPESELSRLNRDPARVVVLSRPFAHALRTALSAAEATEGLVDPTLGRAVVAAGYDKDFPCSEMTSGCRDPRPKVPGGRFVSPGACSHGRPEPSSTSTAWSSRSQSMPRWS